MRRRDLLAALFLGGAMIAPPAEGDTVHLKNGKRLEGEVSPGTSPGKIRVTLDQGVFFEFSREDILKIVEGPSPARQFDERLDRIPRDDLEALLELAAWARERKLRSKEKIVYERILRVDPNHAAAREALGFAVHGNRWVHESQLRKLGLVRHAGEWVEPAERDRREREKLHKEVEDDLRGFDSRNRYVREYSIERIRSRRQDPRLHLILLEHLENPSASIRRAAVEALASVSGGRPRSRSPGGRTGGRSGTDPGKDLDHLIATALLARTLKEENPDVRKALANALMKMRHRRYFETALRTARTSGNALHRERAAEGVLFAIQKDWVPELIDSLDDPPPGMSVAGNPSIHRILKRIFHQDFEYRVRDWHRWWRQNSHRYTDEG